MSDYDPRSSKLPRRGLLWLLFVLPGTVILWWQYHFPKPKEAWATARRKDQPVMRVLYSLAFWLIAVLIIFFLVADLWHGATTSRH